MPKVEDDNVPESSSCTFLNKGITHIKVKTFEYTWIIKNFHCQAFYDTHYSPKFTIDQSSHFDLVIDTTHEEYFAIYASVIHEEKFRVMNVEICLLNDAREEAIVKRVLYDHEDRWLDEPFQKFVKKDFVFDAKNKLLENNALTIICRIYLNNGREEYLTPINQVSKQAPLELDQQRRSQQFDDFERLFTDSKYSDFKLIVATEEFFVHRCILAARSRVFASMIEHDAKESGDSKVEIADIKPQVMREMLRFIYTGKANDIVNLAGDLLIAAAKYELEGLATFCEEILTNGLNLEIINEVLLVIDKDKAERLKNAAIEFVIDNSDALNNSVQFRKTLKSLTTSFLVDLLKSLMARLNVELNKKLTN